MSYSQVKIENWSFDFEKMEAIVAASNSQKKLKLAEVKGELMYLTNPHDYPKHVAAMSDISFNEAVEKAWADFIFERDVLSAPR